MLHLVLDTNVILGYVHKNDRLNTKCTELINKIKKTQRITFFERYHKDDFRSAIKNRVNDNIEKLNNIGLWEFDKNGAYLIQNLDQFEEYAAKQTLTDSDKGWIKTIIKYSKSIEELRTIAPTIAMITITALETEFNKFINQLQSKSRVQFFSINRGSNTTEKNTVLDFLLNNKSLMEYFNIKLDATNKSRRKRIGYMDKKLLILTFYTSLVFPNSDYEFVTDDSDMNPKGDKITSIFRRTFKISTIDECINFSLT